MTQRKDIFINPETNEIEVNMGIILTPTTLVENERIRVRTSGHDYDFIATVENLTEETIYIKFAGEAVWIEPLAPIRSNGWVGLLANTEGYSALEALVNGRYEFVDKEGFYV